MCCEVNEPFFLTINFTDNNAMAIAIINTLKSRVSIIYLYFCNMPMHINVAKLVQKEQNTKKKMINLFKNIELWQN